MPDVRASIDKEGSGLLVGGVASLTSKDMWTLCPASRQRPILKNSPDTIRMLTTIQMGC